MATLALNSGLWVRRLLIGGSLFQGLDPTSEVSDGGCPEKPGNLMYAAKWQEKVFERELMTMLTPEHVEKSGLLLG